MERVYIGAIGLLAGTLTTISFVPQILKISKTRHVRDISLYMYLVMDAGIALWLAYGLLIKELPVILANSVAVFLCSYIIVMKLLYGREERGK